MSPKATPQPQEPEKSKTGSALPDSIPRNLPGTLRERIAFQTKNLQRQRFSLGTPRTVQAGTALLRDVGSITLPEPLPAADRAALAERFFAAAETNHWEEIGELDWSAVWQVLWYESPQPLLLHSRFQIRYRQRLERAKFSRDHRRLIPIYLADFDPSREGIEWIAKLLRKTLLQKTFTDLEFWRQQDFDHELFSVELAPKKIAQTILLSTKQSARDFLAEMGITGPLLTRGLGRAAYVKAIERLAENPVAVAEGTLSAFVDWSLAPSATAPTGVDLLFPDLRKEIYCFVLDPWQGKTAPSPIRRLNAHFFGNTPGRPGEADHSWHEPEEDRPDRINQLD
ncbi:hypothetical protein SAMN05444156_1515 [Verrucomicrobium sp. GAS474]|uniref:hypothetical protein n=1 Tax=Verrucomicrobium sp. GAS474 TaxID=1882831 RepID=UPI00087C49B5|nr:hypothetical protein [Verrucomicrobium sp. GAS474]SDU02522.1 hypothetical protein SAMN05444156_1515 [Verrucomicrobium sp. GAS474]